MPIAGPSNPMNRQLIQAIDRVDEAKRIMGMASVAG